MNRGLTSWNFSFSILTSLSYRSNYAMRALILDDASLTITEILASGYDTLIYSYQFFNSNGKVLYMFYDNIHENAND